MTFSVSFFTLIFSWKMALKMVRGNPTRSPRGGLFLIFFATLSFMFILCWIWLTFGSLLAPFGSLWAPFCSLWAPFWLTFGVPWLTFGALSFTFAHPGINFLTFAVSCRHFSYLLEFSMKISCKIWFLHNFFCLFQAALASRLVGLTEACRPKKAEGEGKF